MVIITLGGNLPDTLEEFILTHLMIKTCLQNFSKYQASRKEFEPNQENLKWPFYRKGEPNIFINEKFNPTSFINRVKGLDFLGGYFES